MGKYDFDDYVKGMVFLSGLVTKAGGLEKELDWLANNRIQEEARFAIASLPFTDITKIFHEQGEFPKFIEYVRSLHLPSVGEEQCTQVPIKDWIGTCMERDIDESDYSQLSRRKITN